MSNRITLIQQRLEQALQPSHIEIIDESHQHIGHAGAKSGGGHFQAIIVSAAFDNKNTLARHRLVYDALAELMHTEIHAFTMKLYTETEYQARNHAELQ